MCRLTCSNTRILALTFQNSILWKSISKQHHCMRLSLLKGKRRIQQSLLLMIRCRKMLLRVHSWPTLRLHIHERWQDFGKPLSQPGIQNGAWRFQQWRRKGKKKLVLHECLASAFIVTLSECSKWSGFDQYNHRYSRNNRGYYCTFE